MGGWVGGGARGVVLRVCQCVRVDDAYPSEEPRGGGRQIGGLIGIYTTFDPALESITTPLYSLRLYISSDTTDLILTPPLSTMVHFPIRQIVERSVDKIKRDTARGESIICRSSSQHPPLPLVMSSRRKS